MKIITFEKKFKLELVNKGIHTNRQGFNAIWGSTSIPSDMLCNEWILGNNRFFVPYELLEQRLETLRVKDYKISLGIFLIKKTLKCWNEEVEAGNL